MTKLDDARAKRARKAARKGASSYAKQNTSDAAEVDRCVYAQGKVERDTTTRELQEDRKLKNGAMLARMFSKAAPLPASAIPPPRPRQHRSQG